MTGSTHWLDLGVATLRQLFDSMDPAPFRDRDLDPAVATYIREWAEEQPREARLGIRVRLSDEPAGATETQLLKEALHENFGRSARDQRRALRRLFRDGRYSLVIGVGFVALAILIAEVAMTQIGNTRYARLIAESVVIGGWVALWQPINIFLYDWWPIRRLAALYDRLAGADVVLVSAADG